MPQSPYYNGFDWPPHVHRQFPEWVTPPGGGEPVLVDNEDQKAAVLARTPIVPVSPAPVATAEPTAPTVDVAALLAQMAAMQAKLDAMSLDADGVDERAELIGQAEAHGVTIDRRWGVDKLRAALAGL